MSLDGLLTNDAVLAELGRRLESHRLQRNLTQAELAHEAQVGRATLQRLERGRSVQTESLIKVLRALELLPALDAAVPQSVESPVAELERQQRRTRQRASGRRTAHHTRPQRESRQPSGPRQPSESRPQRESRPRREPWRWGDEPQAGA